MEKFLFKKEEKKERTIYLMGAALFLLVLSIIFFVIGKTKAKKDKLSGPTLLLVASFLCFSVALFVVALVIMLTPNILETRPTPKESNPGQDERRELESDFVQYHVYQVKNTRMNMCMTAKKVSSGQYCVLKIYFIIFKYYLVTHIDYTTVSWST